MDNVKLVQAVKHIRDFGGELQELWMNVAGPLSAARYARDRMIAELASLNVIVSLAEAEERKQAERCEEERPSRMLALRGGE